jgi:hypothetical protein
MSPRDRVNLLDARLELTRYLTPDELSELAGVRLPVLTVDPGTLDITTLLAKHHAFGATLLDGIVTNSLRIGDQIGIQLLGPGDVLIPTSELLPPWLADFGSHTAAPVRLGLFGNDLLAAAYRWPRIVHGLYACLGDQLQRLTAQLVICQLPRVEDRVLAMLWLLSESWGQVTPSGVRLPLALTHDTLGGLVGAARPTVTLALRELTDRGAVVHQDSGWLLLGLPPEPGESPAHVLPAEVQQADSDLWSPPVAPADPNIAYAELRSTLHRLREQHRTDMETSRQQLKAVINARGRMAATRERITENALRRRWPPSPR